MYKRAVVRIEQRQTANARLHHHIDTQTHLLLRIGSKLLQILKRNLTQRLLVGRVEEDLGHNLIARRLPSSCLKCLEPSAGAQAPLAAALHAWDGAEIVALAGGEVEELFGDFGGDGVVTVV